MLSYQHAYHAGGPADIHKHTALCAVLTSMTEKEKPFVVIDVYGGHGIYDLASSEAQKTGEFERGIGRLWPSRSGPAPGAVSTLLSIIEAENPGGHLRRYPGSPALARAFLRPQDRLILNELHPVAHYDLRRWAARDDRICVHKREGLQALVALLPPQIRRGVVLVDPSYEVKSEYAALPEALRRAFQKWRQGIYLIWYPLLSDDRHLVLLDGVRKDIDAEILASELTFDPPPLRDTPGLLGTGLVVVNPPWQFDRTMREAGDWLAASLPPSGRHALRWLKGD